MKEGINKRELHRRARQRYVKRAKRRIFISISSVIIISMIISLSLFSFAKSDKSVNMQLTYKSIEISEGDSLWNLAVEYNYDASQSTKEMMEEIIEINQLTNTNIVTGQYLIIPVSY